MKLDTPSLLLATSLLAPACGPRHVNNTVPVRTDELSLALGKVHETLGSLGEVIDAGAMDLNKIERGDNVELSFSGLARDSSDGESVWGTTNLSADSHRGCDLQSYRGFSPGSETEVSTESLYINYHPDDAGSTVGVTLFGNNETLTVFRVSCTPRPDGEFCFIQDYNESPDNPKLRTLTLGEIIRVHHSLEAVCEELQSFSKSL